MEEVAFPGIRAIVDGSEAIAHVEVRVSEGACAYPITPSTNMAAVYQAAVADGRTNLWGTRLRFIELESEHSSASAAEGFALAGGRVTNFTAGQGLILMKEVLYVIAGKRLPAVFHVGARALTSQALNIHAGHDDLMGVADVGWGILVARNVQEAGDLAAIARRAAEASETPFICAQDGFLTTHTLEDVSLPEDNLLREYVGDPRARLRDYLDPELALMSGVVQNQDAYMAGRIGQRAFYSGLRPWVERAMREWGELTGRRYGLIEAYRCDDAETIVVCMGTLADTARVAVDRLRERGRAVGVVTIRSLRPFPAELVAAAIGRARAVAVIERTDEPAAADNPLTREVKASLADVAARRIAIPEVRSVSAGLGSRDVAAGDVVAAFDWLDAPAATGDRWRALGVRHPQGLRRAPVDGRPAGAFSLRGHSIGGFGSVTTNKLLASIAGELFGKHVQAYPLYGSEKKGLPTTYYLTIADERIRQHSEVERVDFVTVHDPSAFAHAAPLAGLSDGGIVFVSAPGDAATIRSQLAPAMLAEMERRRLRVFALDTAALAREHAPRPELVTRMQGVALVGVFLRTTPFAEAAGYGREALLRATRAHLGRFFGKRGEAVLDANSALVARAFDDVVEVLPCVDLAAVGAG